MKSTTFLAALAIPLAILSNAVPVDDEVAILKRQIPVRPCSTGVVSETICLIVAIGGMHLMFHQMHRPYKVKRV